MSNWTITAIAIAIGLMLSVGSRCDLLSRIPNDVRSVAAKDKKTVDPAKLEARNANANQVRCLMFVTEAKTDDWVAKGKCHGRTGNVIEIPPWFDATPSMSRWVI
jgi:hypothetical protein